MKPLQIDALKSGYQPRPLALPSAGRALSVLVAAGAVLWVWWMLPDLWPTATQNAVWVWWPGALLGVPLANLAVFLGATRPLGANLTTRPASLELKHLGVLMLCGLFHLFTFLPWLLCLAFYLLFALDGQPLLTL
ncbi:hypothetical protein FY528_16990 [Hymenobacter lutimineralis]|uniref:Uncharacterized protein n=1 Tax=Hymenobacter lutimineralis TaxID=2606448 RepID=A0A5D6UUJ7_9BACT|nr:MULTISPECIES: hypothetical protein [Hymenobacter]QIX60801.1 hypothetical protein HER32_06265 [Hymenobacter sp. BT18]TYZ06757.1 hypothetical protein FY528_16990 [Hymenobacter lutimineralis]